MTPSVASNRLASNPAPGGSAGHHSSPSDIVLVTSSYDRTVRFWNPESLQSGIPYREIQHADSQVNCMAISPDRRFLACGGYQHVQLYDFVGAGAVGGPLGTGGVPAAGGRVMKFNGFSKNIMQLGFQEEASWMYTVGEDGTVRIWEIREDSSSPVLKHDLKCGGPANCAVLHPNQIELIVGDHQGTIHLLDLSKNAVTTQFKIESDLVDDAFVSIQSLALDLDSTMLAALTNKGTCHIWQVSSFVTVKPEHSNSDAATSGRTDSDSTTGGSTEEANSVAGNTSGTTSGTGTSTHVVSSQKFFPKKSFQAHDNYGLKCCFSEDSTLLATCSADGSARVWTTTDFNLLFTLSEDTSSGNGSSSGNWYWDCAFTRDSLHLLTVSSDGRIRCWNLSNGSLKQKWPPSEDQDKVHVKQQPQQSTCKPFTCLAFFEPS
ncbi:target of rapamycin complex subunit LST8-like [Symsagittifera roscoffensis]|uniref:target of rapamycin complex subunit LST8-like n=1 Tax=Symsagittifera roscoffensis TaxID=84072 RepID=UPI00307B4EC6